MLDHLGAVAECSAANVFAVIDGVARDADDPRPPCRGSRAGRSSSSPPSRASRARSATSGRWSSTPPTRCSRPARAPASFRSPRSTATALDDRRRPDRRRARRRLPGADARPALPRAGPRSGCRVTPGESIVIGGGILGATTAWELAREGMDVLLLEAGPLRRAVDRASRPRSCAATTRTPRSCAWPCTRARRSAGCRCSSTATRSTRSCGWLFLVDEERRGRGARERGDAGRGGRRHRSRSTTSRSSCRGSSETGIAYALYEPDAGFADPVATTSAYIEALRRRRAARALEGTPVEPIELERRPGPRRARRRRAASSATASCSPPGRGRSRSRPTIGLELPLEITREQDVVFDDRAGADDPVRGLVADRPGLHAPRARVRRRATSWSGAASRRSTSRSTRTATTTRSTTRSRPTCASASPAGCRSSRACARVGGRVGLYDVTPDWHPILGAVDGYDGLFLATGGSGHCFKLGPAIGELVAGASSALETEYADVRDASRSRASPRAASSARPTEATARDGRPRDPERHGPRRHRRRAVRGRRRDRGRPDRGGRRGARRPTRRRSTPPASPSRPASSTSTATPTTRCSSTRARASAIHQGVTLEVVGNCGFGCFPIRDPELARKAIYGYSDEVPIEWRTAGGYFDRLEAARPAINVLSLVPNGQLRLSTVGLADRPADAAELAEMTDAARASRSPRARGATRPGSSTRRSRARPRRRSPRSAARSRPAAASTRRTRAGATRARPTRSRRRSAPRRAGEVRLQVSHLVPRNGIEESRRSIELVEARPRPRASTSSSTCTRASTASRTSTPRCRRGRSPRSRRSSPRCSATRRPATGCARTGASSAPANDWGRIVLLDNPFWPAVRAPRHRLDRRRARPGAARRGLRPAASARSRRRTS